MRILGLDPGKDVSLCLMVPGEEPIVRKIVSPGKGVSEESLRAAVIELAPDVAYVELVGVMPGQGATSGSTFMVAWGICRGLMLGLGIPYTLVAPLKWKNRVLVARGYDMGDKVPKEKSPEGLTPKARSEWLKESGKRHRKAVSDRKAHQKEQACKFVHAAYPSVELILPRCRVDDHNLAEAVCIAHYGMEVEQELGVTRE